MEGWSRQANRDRDVLMRIVALLVSLANFADAASSLRGRRRRQLLGILCYGEAEGLDFISGLMPAACVQIDEPEPTADAACLTDDPARLAASFRVLALVIYTALKRPFHFTDAAVSDSGERKSSTLHGIRATVPGHDTS